MAWFGLAWILCVVLCVVGGFYLFFLVRWMTDGRTSGWMDIEWVGYGRVGRQERKRKTVAENKGRRDQRGREESMVVGSTGWLVRRWMVGASKEGESMADAYVYLFLDIFILFFLFFLPCGERERVMLSRHDLFFSFPSGVMLLCSGF